MPREKAPSPAMSLRRRGFPVAFLERTSIIEQERPMLEVEHVRFREPLCKILNYSDWDNP